MQSTPQRSQGLISFGPESLSVLAHHSCDLALLPLTLTSTCYPSTGSYTMLRPLEFRSTGMDCTERPLCTLETSHCSTAMQCRSQQYAVGRAYLSGPSDADGLEHHRQLVRPEQGWGWHPRLFQCLAH
jgi:hypothetical protein